MRRKTFQKYWRETLNAQIPDMCLDFARHDKRLSSSCDVITGSALTHGGLDTVALVGIPLRAKTLE